MFSCSNTISLRGGLFQLSSMESLVPVFHKIERGRKYLNLHCLSQKPLAETGNEHASSEVGMPRYQPVVGTVV
jgi:hypothetical protein